MARLHGRARLSFSLSTHFPRIPISASSPHGLLINGEWVSTSQAAPNTNPSNLADVVGEYAQGDASHVDAAVAAATAAFPGWST